MIKFIYYKIHINIIPYILHYTQIFGGYTKMPGILEKLGLGKTETIAKEEKKTSVKEEKTREISAHETTIEMYQRIKDDGLTNVFDRFEAQEPTRCPFCTQGISCQLCSNGPCRITKKADRGVCGIDANGMAMRYMLFRNIMGTATYLFHAKEVAKTLRATGQGKTPYEIKDQKKLMDFAKMVGIEGNGIEETAVQVANFLLEEMHRDSDEPSKMVELFAPQSRIKLWKELGIYPGGPLEENMDALSSCLTNVDADYVSLAKKALRLGIACIYGAQIGLEIGQDILFGTPTPHEAEVDLGIIDPDYVNIIVNGHEPFFGTALIKLAQEEEYQQKTKSAGAKGLKIIGSIETGQELLQRYPIDNVFAGLTGNWLSMEPTIATGAVDVFAMDMNCSIPTLGQYQEKYPTTFVSVSKLVGIPKIEKKMIYKPNEVESKAKELIELAIDNYKKRKANGSAKVPKRKQKVIAGFSIEACLSALGGSLDPLLEVIKNGTLKGIVALVSCTTLKNGGQDTITLAVAKELIKRDIMVLSAGCGNAAVQVGGLCSLEAQELAGDGLNAVCKQLNIPPVLSFGTCTDTGRISMLVTAVANALGVDPSDLPVAVTAPQYMEQKATIDAIFALAYGLYTHVSPVPPVTGAPELVKLLTEDIEGITGGKLAVETDPVKAVDGIEAHIMAKRKKLGI